MKLVHIPPIVYKNRHLSFILIVSLAIISMLFSSLGVNDRQSIQAAGSVPSVSDLTTARPRILATAADFARVKNEITTNTYKREWFAALKTNAQTILTQPVSTYEVTGGRLLETSRRVLDRVMRLGMMYQLEGGTTYTNRAWKELEAAAGRNPNINFPDWHRDHFLDTAEMTAAFAIGYDWMYSAWTTAQRETLRNAIITRGLNPAVSIYRGDRSGPSNRWFWVNTTNNWSIVCNGGISLGAMAIGHESPTLANEILNSAYQNIKNGLGSFKSDGSYPEGVGYWSYATNYLTLYLSSLTASMGSEFGLPQSYPGIMNTGDIPLFLNGPKHSFNYGDTGHGLVHGPQVYWIAKRFNKPMFAVFQRELTVGDPKALLWYDVRTQGSLNGFYRDKHFNQIGVASLRSAWNDPNALYVGFKAGSNQAGHNDLDTGSFVLEALGTRWATDLGQEDYNVPGYWESGPDGRRWNYYRKRAEGQNTLVINPGSGPDQNPLANTTLTKFHASASNVLGIMNLTDAYTAHSTKVYRGIRTFGERSQVLIQDEIVNKSPSEVWWFMHTGSGFAISSDGRSAMLTSGSNRLWARIISPGNAYFSRMNAAPLPTSPQASNTDNGSMRKLTIHLSNVSSTTLSVLLVPLRPGENPPTTLPSVVPLSQWAL